MSPGSWLVGKVCRDGLWAQEEDLEEGPPGECGVHQEVSHSQVQHEKTQPSQFVSGIVHISVVPEKLIRMTSKPIVSASCWSLSPIRIRSQAGHKIE